MIQRAALAKLCEVGLAGIINPPPLDKKLGEVGLVGTNLTKSRRKGKEKTKQKYKRVETTAFQIFELYI